MPLMDGHFVLKYGWLDMVGMEASIERVMVVGQK